MCVALATNKVNIEFRICSVPLSVFLWFFALLFVSPLFDGKLFYIRRRSNPAFASIPEAVIDGDDFRKA